MCPQSPQPREGFGAGEALVHEPLDAGRRGALVGEDFGEVRGRLRGRGGVAPVPLGLGRLDGLHECEAGPERVEAGGLVIAHDHEEMHVVGHDDAVGNGHRRVDGVKRPQIGQNTSPAGSSTGRASPSTSRESIGGRPSSVNVMKKNWRPLWRKVRFMA